LTTSADRGGDDGDDGAEIESIEFEDDDNGVSILVDDSNFRSMGSRRVLQKKEKHESYGI
jgi:hypothetical protein